MGMKHISTSIDSYNNEQYYYTIPDDLSKQVYGYTGAHCFLNEHQFATSWDWLMPVVEKIEALYDDGLVFYIKDTRAYIEVDTQMSMIFEIDMHECYSGSFKTKIEAVYSTVIKFITWHNATPAPKAG